MEARHYMDGNEKLIELTIYISLKSETDEYFGATKLNKLLFVSDFTAFQKFGKSITGQEYQKLEQGPAPRQMRPVLDYLELTGAIKVVERQLGALTQKKTLALRDPILDAFTSKEIALVDQCVTAYRPLTARQMSDLTHDLPCWKLADIGETIPYWAGALDDSPLTDQEQEWADDIDMSNVKELLAA